MQNKKLLTVNVVTYNHAPYIRECLDSILMQETDFDFTVRIFDDGSTDGTQDICREYKEKYPDSIELHFANKNLGLVNGVMQNPLRSYQNIETPYYLYIEGDDKRLNKHGFQLQIDALEAHPECSFCAGQTINNENISTCHPTVAQKIYTKEDIIGNPKKYFFANLMSRIVRTKYIKIPHENPNFYLTDTTQFFELLKQGPIYFIDKIVACYRETDEGYVSGQDYFKRIKQNATELSEYNDYTNKIFSEVLQRFLLVEVHWLTNRKFETQKTKKKIDLKKLKHYLLPPILIDFLNLPRDISRKIRSSQLKKDK